MTPWAYHPCIGLCPALSSGTFWLYFPPFLLYVPLLNVEVTYSIFCPCKMSWILLCIRLFLHFQSTHDDCMEHSQNSIFRYRSIFLCLHWSPMLFSVCQWNYDYVYYAYTLIVLSRHQYNVYFPLKKMISWNQK